MNMIDFPLDFSQLSFITELLEKDTQVVRRWTEIKDVLLTQYYVHKHVIEQQIKKGKPFSEFSRKTLEKWIEVEGSEATFNKFCCVLCELNLQAVQEKLMKSQELITHLGKRRSSIKILEKSIETEVLTNTEIETKSYEVNDRYEQNVTVDIDDSSISTAIIRYKTLKRDLGPEHFDTLAAKSEVGVKYEENGDISNALRSHRKVLSIRLRIFSDDHEDTIKIKRRIADLSDSREESIQLLKEVHESRLRNLGPKHDDSQDACATLAEFLNKDGAHKDEVDAAYKLYTKLYETRKDKLGEENILTITARIGIADIFRQKDEFDAAVDVYLEILEVMEKTLGEEHELVKKTKKAVIRIIDSMEDTMCDARIRDAKRREKYQPVISLLAKQDAILQQIEELSSPRNASGLLSRLLRDPASGATDLPVGIEDKVADTEKNSEDTKMEIESLKQEQLTIDEEIKAAELALKPFEDRDNEDFEKCTELLHAHRILSRATGYDNPCVIRLRDKIIAQMFAPKDTWTVDTAITQLKRIYEVRCLILGEGQEDTIDALSGLCRLQWLKGELDESLKLCRVLYGISRKKYGEGDPQTVRRMTNIGQLLMDQGNQIESIVVLKALLPIQHQLFGEESREILYTRLYIGKAFLEIGEDLEDTLKYFNELKTDQVRILGDEHGDSFESSLAICKLLIAAEKPSEALETLKEIVSIAPKNQIEELSEYMVGIGHLGIAETMHLIGRGDSDYSESRTTYEHAEEAISICKEAIHEFQRLFGDTNDISFGAQRDLVKILEETGDLDGALALQRSLYDSKRSIKGDTDPQTLSYKLHIASILEMKEEFAEADSILTEIYELRKKELGEEDPNVLRIRLALATSKVNCGLLQEAVDMVNEIYLIRKKVLGENDEDTINTHKVLAVYLEELGQMDDACQIHQEICSALEAHLGKEHKDTLQARIVYVNFLYKMSRIDDAIPHQRELIDILKQVQGENHAETLNNIILLAVFLTEKRELNEALKNFESVLIVRRKELGEEHEDTLVVAKLLALTLEQLGRKDEALTVFKQMYDVRRRVLGEDHKDTLEVKYFLASTIVSLGKWDEGEALLKSLLEAHIAEKNSTAIAVKHDLAQLLCDRGRFVESMQLFQETLEMCKQTLGEAHRLTVCVKHNIGNLLLEQGYYKEALKILEEVLEFLLEDSGAEDESYLNTKFTIGEVLDKSEKQADRDRALQTFREVCEVQTKLVPAENRTLNAMKHAIATNLTARGQTTEAETLLQSVMRVHIQVYGEHHMYTLKTRRSIGDNLAREGKTENAIKIYEEVISAQKKYLGQEHPETLKTQYNLASGLEASKRKGVLAKAYEMFKEVLEKRKRVLGEHHPDTRETQERMSILSVKIARKMNSKCAIS